MPSVCCLTQCQKSLEQLHYFPKNSTLRNSWLQAIRKLGWEPGKARICFRHFKKEDYVTQFEFGKLLFLLILKY